MSRIICKQKILKWKKVSEKAYIRISLPWIMYSGDFIYMKSAQNAQTFFVYLCKMPFLEKNKKNAKKRLTFFSG